MALISAEGKRKEVNEALCSIIGYSHAELSALTFQDINHWVDLETDLKLLNELIEEKRQSYQMEKRYVHKDGHIVWVFLAVSMVKDQYEKIVHFISQIQDITEQKLAEKALLAKRKLLKTIIDNLPLNVYLKDLQSKKILANKSEMDYVGAINDVDVPGKNDYDLYPDYSAAISLEEDQFVFNTCKSLFNKETPSLKKDGTQTWFLS